MDDLTRRYAKALAAEVEARFCAEEAETRVKAFETRALAGTITTDPKLAQWKAQNETEMELLRYPPYKKARGRLLSERHAHARAKARLAVVEERVKLRRAMLYAKET